MRGVPRTFLLRVAVASVLAVVAGSTALGAPDARDGGGGPRIRFAPTRHDFGALRSDQRVAHDWVYHNDGDAPLRILSTRPQCGCTAVVPSDDPVPPGGTGTLRVTFDAAGLHGTIRKSLAVTSNDPVQPRVLLTITADVTPVDEPVDESGHPRIAGQSMLVGGCVSCHAEPARGKTGAELYSAVCAMCHGPDGNGGKAAPSIREPSYLGSLSDVELSTAIAYGTANPNMPGFLDLMGGPLSANQVDSLVRLMRSWSDSKETVEPRSGGGRPR